MNDKNGFNLVIAVTELRERLLSRVKYHESRMKFYAEKAKEFHGDREKVQQGVSNRTMGRHEDELARSGEHHVLQARYLQFIADHLPKAKTVELALGDLNSFELLEA